MIRSIKIIIKDYNQLEFETIMSSIVPVILNHRPFTLPSIY